MDDNGWVYLLGLLVVGLTLLLVKAIAPRRIAAVATWDRVELWLLVGVLVVAVVAAVGSTKAVPAYRALTAGPVGKLLLREVRNPGASRVDLSTLSAFDWDEFFLFGPYTERSSVCKRLQLSDEACRAAWSGSSVAEGDWLFVFRAKGVVTHVEEYFRSQGDFMPIARQQPIARSRAKFRVAPIGDGRAMLELE